VWYTCACGNKVYARNNDEKKHVGEFVEVMSFTAAARKCGNCTVYCLKASAARVFITSQWFHKLVKW
jgi:hypothetical protein